MKRAIIITGTSSGLGKSFFDLLKSRGSSLICISRRFLPEQGAAALSGNILLIKHDLRDVDNLLKSCSLERRLEQINPEEVVFINNAGVVGPIGPVGSIRPDEMLVSIKVNMAAPILLANELKSWCDKAAARFKILNISTGAAVRPIPGWAMYCSTKAGTRMFFEVINQSEGQEVINIDPGVMDTGMQADIRQSSAENFPLHDYFSGLKDSGALVSPEEKAREIIEKYLQA
jgi:benzil reductase ((S)-benzoin forming)